MLLYILEFWFDLAIKHLMSYVIYTYIWSEPGYLQLSANLLLPLLISVKRAKMTAASAAKAAQSECQIVLSEREDSISF